MFGGNLNSIIITTTGEDIPKSYNLITLKPDRWILFGNITFQSLILMH